PNPGHDAPDAPESSTVKQFTPRAAYRNPLLPRFLVWLNCTLSLACNLVFSFCTNSSLLGRPGLFHIAWYTSSTVVEMKRLLTVETVANYTFQSVVLQEQERLRSMRTPHIEMWGLRA
ncbi:MAG: hypothetical protein WBW48_16470, partial [Anaerolineae bacterium]